MGKAAYSYQTQYAFNIGRLTLCYFSNSFEYFSVVGGDCIEETEEERFSFIAQCMYGTITRLIRNLNQKEKNLVTLDLLGE